MQMPRGEHNLIDIIHVKFDNVDAGIFLKNFFKKWNEGMCTYHSCY